MENKTGKCHCGKVMYSVSLDISKPVIECNCSYCQSKGLLLAFVSADAFTLRAGADDMQEYRFNNRVIQHLFCTICGVQPFSRGKTSDGKETIAINVRTIDDIDISTLTRAPFDGKGK